MNQRSSFRLLTVLLSGLLLAACGGGGGGSNNPGGTNPPVANAGPDQTAKHGVTVTLDASASTDPDGDALTFAWSLLTGPQVDLSDVNSEKPTFVADARSGSFAYAFELTVTDSGGTSDTETVQINVIDTVAADAVLRTPNIGVREEIVIEFSESMNPETLTLHESLLAASDGGTWSRTTFDNDTLTLRPAGDKGAWESGQRDFSLSVHDIAGNESVVNELVNIRVLFETFQEASIVIGQPDFVSNTSHQGGLPALNTVELPFGNPGYDPVNDLLFLPDWGANRVMAYQGVPESSNAAASFMVGQVDGTSTDNGTSANAISGPQTVSVHDGKLVLAEYTNNRISIFENVPLAGPGSIEVVLGQANKTSSSPACDANSLNTPETHIVTPDGKLLVTDTNNNRVLIWNSIPNVDDGDGKQPDLVLGQSDFTHCENNDDNQDGVDGEATARTFHDPAGIWSDGEKLVVLDNGNSRILIWNTFPTVDFQPADIVLGQATFGNVTRNDDNQDGSEDPAPTARTVDLPYNGVYSNGLQLFVADSNNNRILVWNTFPTENFQPADVVLGQGDFSHRTFNDDDQNNVRDLSPSARTLNFPTGLLLVFDKLIVSDSSNARFLVFESR